MSDTGKRHDNATFEMFFKNIKVELIWRRS
jgi:hypothetical protein